MNEDKFRLSSTFITKTNPSKAKADITEMATQKSGGYICVTNLRMVKYADNHPAYAEIMNKSAMNLPDGVPLTWCGKAWGLENIAVTNGPSLFKEFMTNSPKELKHYLIGDTQEVLDRIVEKFAGGYGTQIVGTYSPPFIPVEKFDYKKIAEDIKNSGANIVWTAMTAPKQDEFNAILQGYAPEVVSIGVGRAFRLSIGEVKDAPGWAKKLGIGGFFMRRRKWYQTGWWYLTNSFNVAKFIAQIKYQKLNGKKYYE